ncbi:hypothetical protein G6F32_016866 [Rhizopus arrhizus]|nr:hypothetical protein G6F32_016866 [Rhizopus arrhizus]
MSTAFARLREHNYTLWSVDAGSDGFSGVMALTRDDDAMLALCSLLNVEIRLGSDPFCAGEVGAEPAYGWMPTLVGMPCA